jgi:hypothetical protein
MGRTPFTVPMCFSRWLGKDRMDIDHHNAHVEGADVRMVDEVGVEGDETSNLRLGR